MKDLITSRFTCQEERDTKNNEDSEDREEIDFVTKEDNKVENEHVSEDRKYSD